MGNSTTKISLTYLSSHPLPRPYPWINSHEAHGTRTCRALEKRWLTRSYFLSLLMPATPSRLGSRDNVSDVSWFQLCSSIPIPEIYQIGGMNEPSRDLWVWICEFSSCSEMNLRALSAASIGGKFRRIPQIRGAFTRNHTISLTL